MIAASDALSLADGPAAWVVDQWRAADAVAIAALPCVVVLQNAAARLGLWPYALLSLPGTLMHELAHYGMALLLRAKPGFPTSGHNALGGIGAWVRSAAARRGGVRCRSRWRLWVFCH